jgi:hypothetical protein
VRRAARVVDVPAIRLVGDRRDTGAEPPEDLRTDLVRGAVRAIEDDVEAREVEIVETLMKGAQVVLRRAVQVAHATDRARRGVRPACRDREFDLDLCVVGELVAVAAEELDPVVAPAVVRGRQHDAEVEAVAVDQQRRRRRGQDPRQQRIAAGRADAGGDRGLEHLARLACVAHDQDLRTVGFELGCGRTRERERELGADELARDAADAVGPEQPAGHRSS